MGQMKLVDGDKLDNQLGTLASAIREAGGTEELLAFPEGFVEAVSSLAAPDFDIMVQYLEEQLFSFASDTVSAVRTHAFYEYEPLRSIAFPAAADVGTYAFNGCPNLKTARLDSVRTVTGGAFGYCTSLTEVYIPKVFQINGYAFQGCSSLAYLDAHHVAYILNNAFSNCTALVTLILRRTTVCKLYDPNTFSNTPIAAGTGYIYVPAILVDAYKTADGWSAYADQFRAIEDYPEICGGETE